MNGNKKKLILAVVLIAAAAMSYYGWNLYTDLRLRGKIEASGTIEAIEVQVGSKVAGRVLARYVDEGSLVKAGDPIALIDVPEIKAQYDAAKARADLAESSYQRIAKLFAEAMASKQQYDDASSARIQAKAMLDSSQVMLDNARITATVPGTVLTKAVEPGELISQGGTIITMADLTVLELEVYVPEAQVGRIDLGDRALIHVDSFPGEKFEGAVIRISNKAEFTPKNIQTKEERVNQVYSVKIKIPNPELRLKPGMPADAEIVIKR